MTDTIKIYRGISKLTGREAVFAVNKSGRVIEGGNHSLSPWVHAEVSASEFAFMPLGHGITLTLDDHCKNPTLVREVRK